MTGKYRLRRAFVTCTNSPRIDTIEFDAVLTKDELETPLKGEYTYTGLETENKYAYSHSDKVESWKIECRTKNDLTFKITKQAGNTVEWECKLGKTQTTTHPRFGSVVVRLLLKATMKPSDWAGNWVGSQKSKVYHSRKCRYCNRIHRLVVMSADEKNKRRLCKTEK